jgi:hypothetical protein
MSSACKITRRGFKARNYPVPADVIEQAEEHIAAEREHGAERILAELRISAYCGPGSAGDRGAYTLDLNVWCSPRNRHQIITIERSGCPECRNPGSQPELHTVGDVCAFGSEAS